MDAYSRNDPERIFDLVPALGQGSPFEAEFGDYLDVREAFEEDRH